MILDDVMNVASEEHDIEYNQATLDDGGKVVQCHPCQCHIDIEEQIS